MFTGPETDLTIQKFQEKLIKKNHCGSYYDANAIHFIRNRWWLASRGGNDHVWRLLLIDFPLANSALMAEVYMAGIVRLKEFPHFDFIPSKNPFVTLREPEKLSVDPSVKETMNGFYGGLDQNRVFQAAVIQKIIEADDELHVAQLIVEE